MLSCGSYVGGELGVKHTPEPRARYFNFLKREYVESCTCFYPAGQVAQLPRSNHAAKSIDRMGHASRRLHIACSGELPEPIPARLHADRKLPRSEAKIALSSTCPEAGWLAEPSSSVPGSSCVA